jgi:hypothetical protein
VLGQVGHRGERDDLGALAARGYPRDHKSGKAQIEHGLMADAEGQPISTEVFAGNSAPERLRLLPGPRPRRGSAGLWQHEGDRSRPTPDLNPIPLS